MTDPQDLYQEIILDLNRRPKNFGELAGANRRAEGRNPLCGDELTVFLKMRDDLIEDISFTGTGCAISKASASLMTTSVKGKTRTEAERLFGAFHDLVMGKGVDADPGSGERRGTADPVLGKLAVFSGVSKFPARVKCASLSWHTLRAALDQAGRPVTTE
jgi:nitrogen fixation NifU-like protein